ncbi:hypothetical protein, partial [Teichococcus aerofrigidensis]
TIFRIVSAAPRHMNHAPARPPPTARAAGPEGAALGAAAARSAREVFAPEVFCRKVAEVYDQVVATHAESRA